MSPSIFFVLFVGASASCVNYQATSYYNNKVSTPGLPPSNNKVYVRLPGSLTPCDLETIQQHCVDRVNMYRSGALKFSNGQSDPGIPKPAINHYTQGDRCANAMAFGDLWLNNGAGGCAAAHSNAFSCPGGNSGQNTCCYRSGTTVAQITSQLDGCLQQMWDEGIGLPDNAGFTSANGHWYNMRSLNSYLACGFAFTSDGGLWMNQDYFSSASGTACSCPGAAGTSDGCGGTCYATGGGAAACPAAYSQNGYSVSGCGANTASGTACSASCASQYAGTVAGTVSCSNGAYVGSYTGCVPYCPVDQGWPATAPGVTASQNCPVGQVGSVTRKCASTGQWQTAVVSCTTPQTCTDGLQNQDETCIDCGGTICPACQPCDCVNCGPHGSCSNGTCVCTGGWTGAQCSTPPDPCLGVTCKNGGTCSGGVCNCINGYTGADCGTAPPATCTDGIKNQDETAIDCGGTICPACAVYQWVAGDWGDCSASCGGGTQTRGVQCELANGTVVDPANCASLHPLDISQMCNIDTCPTFTWITGQWGVCSSPCNTGFQTRTVQCQSSVGPAIVQTGCTAATMPPSQQNCNTEPCTNFHWVSQAWTPCTVSCGGGTQSRIIECQDINDANTTWDKCDSTMQPPTAQSCNLQICETYRWLPCPSFLPCTAQCNGGGSMVGVQYRDVFCIRLSDSAVVDNSLCTDPQPTSALSVCNTQPCGGFNWMANANWGPCVQDPVTMKYARHRSFHCHDKTGQTVTIAQCQQFGGKQPIADLPCAPGVCSDANGCPLVQIGTMFNYCSKIPDDCKAGSACAVAAKDLDDGFFALGTTANAAAACIETYNAGLDASAQVSTTMIQAVKARLQGGQQVCDLTLSPASTVTFSVVSLLFGVAVMWF